MIKALVFDFNGTLDKYQEERIKALVDITKEVDPSVKERREAAREILVGIERIDNEDPKKDMIDIFLEALEDFFGKEKIEELDVKKLYKLYKEKRGEYEGVEESFLEVVKNLGEKYKLFILSHANKEKIKKRLKRFGILRYFDKIYITKEHGLRKPNIEIYKIILEENEFKGEECVMVGDDPLLDLLPAKVSGMKTLLFSEYVDGAIFDYRDLQKTIEDL